MNIYNLYDFFNVSVIKKIKIEMQLYVYNKNNTEEIPLC